MNIKTINAEWLNKKIIQHYNGNKKAFSEDTNGILTYSMITKHTTGEAITERFKLTYFLWFDKLERTKSWKKEIKEIELILNGDTIELDICYVQTLIHNLRLYRSLISGV